MNQIKFLNGDVFSSLNNLRIVMLSSNDCINEDFDSPNRIALLPKIIDDKCRYESIDTCGPRLLKSLCFSLGFGTSKRTEHFVLRFVLDHNFAAWCVSVVLVLIENLC